MRLEGEARTVADDLTALQSHSLTAFPLLKRGVLQERADEGAGGVGAEHGQERERADGRNAARRDAIEQRHASRRGRQREVDLRQLLVDAVIAPFRQFERRRMTRYGSRVV